ncbi:hypothetical protein [Plebeiibacterium marinum]|uniref:Uncharacterized protein n=1 Tax=Plebeiibacterium marinum TaxID=2992111 RepID=A0AAE3MHM2_9BACT|nr:hypothetical protein [Plebeiobacterium marinum]MCW3807786.1 hypothetical protein [Plebeiobacterium marinum]
MKKLIYYCLLILTLVFIGEMKSEAKKVSGYIITNQNDTIKGEVKLYTFARRNGQVTLNSFDYEMTFVEVPFCKSGEKKITVYKPTDIKEYGFTFKKILYKYKSFLVKTNNISLNHREKQHFLQLARKEGRTEIYKHQKYRLSKDNMENIPYYVFYTYSEKNGLQSVK